MAHFRWTDEVVQFARELRRSGKLYREIAEAMHHRFNFWPTPHSVAAQLRDQAAAEYQVQTKLPRAALEDALLLRLGGLPWHTITCRLNARHHGGFTVAQVKAQVEPLVAAPPPPEPAVPEPPVAPKPQPRLQSTQSRPQSTPAPWKSCMTGPDPFREQRLAARQTASVGRV
jgi:hypothetical protein